MCMTKNNISVYDSRVRQDRVIRRDRSMTIDTDSNTIDRESLISLGQIDLAFWLMNGRGVSTWSRATIK